MNDRIFLKVEPSVFRNDNNNNHKIILIMTQVERCHGTDPVNGEPNWVSSLSTLYNSDMVLTGSRDGFIRIWSIGEGFRSIKPVGTIQVSALLHLFCVGSVSFWCGSSFWIRPEQNEFGSRSNSWTVLKDLLLCYSYWLFFKLTLDESHQLRFVIWEKKVFFSRFRFKVCTLFFSRIRIQETEMLRIRILSTASFVFIQINGLLTSFQVALDFSSGSSMSDS